jgi:hypothetical protein
MNQSARNSDLLVAWDQKEDEEKLEVLNSVLNSSSGDSGNSVQQKSAKEIVACLEEDVTEMEATTPEKRPIWFPVKKFSVATN